MERRSFSGPPKDSDCMTNHVQHHPPNPTQNLQTTASLGWKKEFLQLCRVKLGPLPLLNYSIVASSFKLLHFKPYGLFEHLQVMLSPSFMSRLVRKVGIDSKSKQQRWNYRGMLLKNVWWVCNNCWLLNKYKCFIMYWSRYSVESILITTL